MSLLPKHLQALKKLTRDLKSYTALKIMAARNETISEVSTILDELHKSDLDSTVGRHEVVQLFKQIDEIGLGSFRTGRRGKESRIEWNGHIKNYLSELDAGKEKPLVTQAEEELPHPHREEPLAHPLTKERSIAHIYWLRSDYSVELTLPINFTAKEATRFAEFVRSLPLE